MPCSLAAACATAAKASGVEVVRRGVDQVAGAVELLGHGGGALDGGLVRLVAGLGAEQGDLGERGLAVLGLGGVALGGPFAVPLLLVGVEGVRAEQRALGDGGDVAAASSSGSANAAFFDPASARAAAPAARRSASASNDSSFSGAAPRPTATTSGALKPDGAGSFVTSPSAPEAPRVSRTPASLPSYALSTASAPGATTRSPAWRGALRDTDDDRVGAQAGAAAVLRVRAVTVVKSRFRLSFPWPNGGVDQPWGGPWIRGTRQDPGSAAPGSAGRGSPARARQPRPCAAAPPGRGSAGPLGLRPVRGAKDERL